MRRKFRKDIPKSVDEVSKYMKDKGITSFTAERFYSFYDSRGWVCKDGIPVANWKSLLESWIPLEKGNTASHEGKNQLRKTTTPTIDHIGEQIEREARQARQKELSVSYEEYQRMEVRRKVSM